MAYLNLAVIQNACIIQMIDIQKVKMKRADRLLEQSKLFYKNFADSLDHWYVMFKGQIEGWAVQYISFFVKTIIDNSLDQFQMYIEMIYLAAIYLERFMNRKFKIFCKFFRYQSKYIELGYWPEKSLKKIIQSISTSKII